MAERGEIAEEPRAAWHRLLSELPAQVVGAAELCALPHGIDDELATVLLQEVGSYNGTTPRALSEVKHLPFVVELNGVLHVSTEARQALIERVRSSDEAFFRGNRVISDVLGSRLRDQNDPVSARTRRLHWGFAFHLAPVDADSAIHELDRIVQRGSTLRTLVDVRAVVELTSEQGEWFAGHAIDLMYYEGRLAFEEGRHRIAERKLKPVWEQSEDQDKRVIAGHFLGSIWGGPDAGGRWREASSILEEAEGLAAQTGNRRDQAMILHTLGALRLRRHGQRDVEGAVEALRRSSELSEAVGDKRTELFARVSLGFALMDIRQFGEAEKQLRSALALERDESLGVKAMADVALGRLLARSGPKHRKEAAKLIEAGIRRARRHNLTRELALNLEALADLLVRGRDRDAGRVKELLEESLRLGAEISDLRHQAIVLGRLVRLAEREGDLEDAVARQRDVVELNERRRDPRWVRRSQRDLKRLEEQLKEKRGADSDAGSGEPL